MGYRYLEFRMCNIGDNLGYTFMDEFENHSEEKKQIINPVRPICC